MNESPENPHTRALYVATDLESWETEKPQAWARDVTISGTVFRRLDADYFAEE